MVQVHGGVYLCQIVRIVLVELGGLVWNLTRRPTLSVWRANIVVTPADALVINTDEFRRVIAKALLMTDQSKAIVTIGIRPCRPETGYGYIAAGEEVDQDIRKVDEFKEKPDLKTARHYVDAGNYFWNAGIFVWNVKTIEEAIRRYAPGIAEVFDRIYPEFYTEREKETIEELFPACESISIDYAVMEKAERIYVLPAEFGWSDLGSWGSLHSLLPKDEPEQCHRRRKYPIV